MTAKLGLLDPNLSSLNSLKKILKDFDCFVFTHPEEMLSKIKKENFDLLISEWELPSLAGDDFCRKIGKDYSNVPILFLSGVRDPDVKIKALQAGAIDFITKPFDRDFLLAKLKSILRFAQNLKCQDNSEPAPKEKLLPIEQIEKYLKEQNTDLVPKLDLNSPYGYFYDLDFLGSKYNFSTEEMIEIFEEAVQQKRLEKKIFDIINICPKCSSNHLNLRNICFKCHTPLLTKKNGNSCPQCFSEIKKAEISYHCLNCGIIFNESESDSKVFYSYFLNQKDNVDNINKSENFILLELVRDHGFVPVLNKTFKQFPDNYKSPGEFVPGTFALLQLKFSNISSQTKNNETVKKINHILLILKKIIHSNEPVFFHPPNILSIKLSVSSFQEAEEKIKKFQYYLNQFELAHLVNIHLSKEELDVVLGFLEKDSVSDEELP